MTQPSWEGAASGGGWGPPPQGGQGWPTPPPTGGGGSPPEPGAVSATDVLSFAWKRVTSDFVPIVATLFFGVMLGALPSILLTGGAMGYQISQVRPGHPPDPNDPVVLVAQVVSSVLTLFSQGFMSGGVYLYSIKVARGEARSFGDVFSGGRFFGAAFTISGLISLLFLPGIVGSKVAMALGVTPILATPIVYAGMVPGMFFALAWSLALPIAVDRGLSGIAAMKESWRLTTGHRTSMFLGFLIMFLLTIPAMCACCLGMPVVTALMTVMIATFYLRLSGQPTAPV